MVRSSFLKEGLAIVCVYLRLFASFSCHQFSDIECIFYAASVLGFEFAVCELCDHAVVKVCACDPFIRQ